MRERNLHELSAAFQPTNPSLAMPPHVAFVAFPFGTHAAPLLALARAVAAAAPAGAAFSFLSLQSSLDSLRRSAPPDSIRFVAFSDGAAPEDLANLGFFGAVLKAAPRTVSDGLAACAAQSGAPVTCVVCDAFLWEAAEAAGLPWVALWTGGPHALAAHHFTDDIRRRFTGEGSAGVSSNPDDLLAGVPGLAAHRLRDLPDLVFGSKADSLLERIARLMTQSLPKAAAVVSNTFRGLDADLDALFSDAFAAYLPVGPLHVFPPAPPAAAHDPDGCLAWLDGHPPASVAYISFGTARVQHPQVLADILAGLESAGVPFLLSLKEDLRGSLPASAGKLGLVVSWAPQVSVLSHAAVGLYISHCGWNSVVESIAAGVPMLCKPIFADQFMSARSVASVWGFGVGVEDGEGAAGVARAAELVLRSEEGRAVREAAARVKKMAVAAVGDGGSSSESFGRLMEIVCSTKALENGRHSEQYHYAFTSN